MSIAFDEKHTKGIFYANRSAFSPRLHLADLNPNPEVAQGSLVPWIASLIELREADNGIE